MTVLTFVVMLVLESLGRLQFDTQRHLVYRLGAHHQQGDLGLALERLGVDGHSAHAVGFEPQLAAFETYGDPRTMGFPAFAVGIFKDQGQAFAHGKGLAQTGRKV